MALAGCGVLGGGGAAFAALRKGGGAFALGTGPFGSGGASAALGDGPGAGGPGAGGSGAGGPGAGGAWAGGAWAGSCGGRPVGWPGGPRFSGLGMVGLLSSCLLASCHITHLPCSIIQYCPCHH